MTGRKNLVAIGSETDASNAGAIASEQALSQAAEPDEGASEILLDDQYAEESALEYEEALPRVRRFGWVAPLLAILAVIGWSAFFVQAHLAEMIMPAAPLQWSDWIVDWSIPVALILLVWLLAMRTSRREAGRFADAAQSLARESADLEARLVTVNRELSLARDFIAAQSRDLESLGRIAAERLSHNADHLQNLIQHNGEQVEAIGRVSAIAVENMDRLRDGLPVISNSSRDVASQIGQAGNVAKSQLDELIAGFNRLNEFGMASELQVNSLRNRVNDAIGAFGEQLAQMEELSAKRFTELSEKSSEFRAELDAREVDAFAAIRRRADTLKNELEQRGQEVSSAETAAIEALQARMAALREEGAQLADKLRSGESEAGQLWSTAIERLEEQMTEAIGKVADVDRHAMENARARLDELREEAERVDRVIAERYSVFETNLRQRSAQADKREADALEALEDRFAAFDDQMLDRQEEQLAHIEGLAERGEALTSRLTEIDEQIARLSKQSSAAGENLSLASAALAERLAESRSILEESSQKISGLTNDSVRLLEIVRSGAEHARKSLPEAIGEAEKQLTAFTETAQAINTLIGDAHDKGAALAEHVSAAQVGGSATIEQLTQLESRLADLAGRSQTLAEQARNELSGAIATLEQASTDVLAKFGEDKADAIREIADRIGTESSEAIEMALREHAANAIADLQKTAFQAGETGREVAVQLRDQLAIVNELAGNLEQRVAHARERAEEQVDNDFARRMALITESLNSSAIDISKVFDNEVTDTAWAGYLKGDRGIFTRRAVRLLDNQEARSIADIYRTDDAFRETVSRYIHDFEAMLRSILSTRDGHALAVTLLSSDMGKLYVALAQAIERLRN